MYSEGETSMSNKEEARIVIGQIELTQAQSLAVRVAVSNMLMDLKRPQFREEMGHIGLIYENRLEEVQGLILADAH